LAKARQIRGEIKQVPTWMLNYDAADPVARLVAERVALNARDAGVTLQLTNGAADIRLVRIPLASLDARLALMRLEEAVGVPVAPVAGNSAEELYAAESAVMRSQRVIPLLHVRCAFAVATTVRGWTTGRDGSWHLADAWLDTAGGNK